MLFALAVQQLLSAPHCAAFCPFFSSPCDILYHFLLQLSRVTAILEVAILFEYFCKTDINQCFPKIQEQDYRTVFDRYGSELTIQEIISKCTNA